jgi:hypothetical protein
VTLLPHPFNEGEFVDSEDVKALKRVLMEWDAWRIKNYWDKWNRAADIESAYWDIAEPADLPRRSRQTDKQTRIAKCPRCSMKPAEKKKAA